MKTPRYYNVSQEVKNYLDSWAKRQISNNLTCDSSLVDDLIKESSDARRGSVAAQFDIDNIQNLYPILPEASDIEEWSVEQSEEFLSDNDRLTDLRRYVPRSEYSEDAAGTEEYHLAVIDHTANELRDIADNQEPQEIFEWWRVTDSWLSSKLSESGKPILSNDYGTWWGRTCSGQAIYLDGTLQDIYLTTFGMPDSDTLAHFSKNHGGID